LHIVLLSQHSPGAPIQIAGVKNQRLWRGAPTDPARDRSLHSALRASLREQSRYRIKVGTSRDQI
ncbi:MAG: hypothetical protein ACR2KV_00955, partial [Solirubrobacteraceae bacterium]